MSDLSPQQMPLKVCNIRESENLCDICDNNGFIIVRDQRIDAAKEIVTRLNEEHAQHSVQRTAETVPQIGSLEKSREINNKVAG